MELHGRREGKILVKGGSSFGQRASESQIGHVRLVCQPSFGKVLVKFWQSKEKVKFWQSFGKVRNVRFVGFVTVWDDSSWFGRK